MSRIDFLYDDTYMISETNCTGNNHIVLTLEELQQIIRVSRRLMKKRNWKEIWYKGWDNV